MGCLWHLMQPVDPRDTGQQGTAWLMEGVESVCPTRGHSDSSLFFKTPCQPDKTTLWPFKPRATSMRLLGAPRDSCALLHCQCLHEGGKGAKKNLPSQAAMTQSGWLRQQKFFLFTVLEAGSPSSRFQPILCPVRSPFLTCRQPLLGMSSQVVSSAHAHGKRQQALWCLFLQGHNFRGARALIELPSPETVTLGVRASVCECGRGGGPKHSAPNT